MLKNILMVAFLLLFVGNTSCFAEWIHMKYDSGKEADLMFDNSRTVEYTDKGQDFMIVMFKFDNKDKARKATFNKTLREYEWICDGDKVVESYDNSPTFERLAKQADEDYMANH